MMDAKKELCWRVHEALSDNHPTKEDIKSMEQMGMLNGYPDALRADRDFLWLRWQQAELSSRIQMHKTAIEEPFMAGWSPEEIMDYHCLPQAERQEQQQEYIASVQRKARLHENLLCLEKFFAEQLEQAILLFRCANPDFHDVTIPYIEIPLQEHMHIDTLGIDCDVLMRITDRAEQRYLLRNKKSIRNRYIIMTGRIDNHNRSSLVVLNGFRKKEAWKLFNDYYSRPSASADREAVSVGQYTGQIKLEDTAAALDGSDQLSA